MRLWLRLCGIRRLRGLCRVRLGGLHRVLDVRISRVLLLLLLLLLGVSGARRCADGGARGRMGQEPVQERSAGGVLPHWIESRTPLAMVPQAVLRAL